MDSVQKRHSVNYQSVINQSAGIPSAPKQNDYAMRNAMYASLLTTVIDDDIKQLAKLSQANKSTSSSQTQLTQSTVNQTHAFTELHRWLSRSHDMLIRMAAYRAINFLAQLPKDILDTNVRLENLQVRLEGITGSAYQAKKQFDELLALDIRSPFDIEGLATASTMMQNYGLSLQTVTAANENFKNTLSTESDLLGIFADQTSRLGGSTDTLTGIVRQFSQAWAKNKLQMQDMRPIIERGVQALDIAVEAVFRLDKEQEKLGGNKAIRKTVGDILDMSKAGTLNRDVMAKMFEVMNERNSGASLRAMETLGGSLSNIKTALIQLYDNMMDKNAETSFTHAFQGIGNTMLFFSESLKSTSDNAKSVFGLIGNLATVLAGIIGIRLVGAISGYVASLVPAATATTSWTLLNKPLSQSLWAVNSASFTLTNTVKLLGLAVKGLLAYGLVEFFVDAGAGAGKFNNLMSNALITSIAFAKEAAETSRHNWALKFSFSQSEIESENKKHADIINNIHSEWTAKQSYNQKIIDDNANVSAEQQKQNDNMTALAEAETANQQARYADQIDQLKTRFSMTKEQFNLEKEIKKELGKIDFSGVPQGDFKTKALAEQSAKSQAEAILRVGLAQEDVAKQREESEKE
jgi:tape measure domain-containing protein